MGRSLCAVMLLALFMGLSAFGQANWPQFRGPQAGVVEDKVLPDTWSTSEHVAWTAEIPGRGWSSPIVWGDRVFVTSAVAEGQTEMPKKGLYLGGNRLSSHADFRSPIPAALKPKRPSRTAAGTGTATTCTSSMPR